jgi:hypothetical protein
MIICPFTLFYHHSISLPWRAIEVQMMQLHGNSPHRTCSRVDRQSALGSRVVPLPPVRSLETIQKHAKDCLGKRWPVWVLNIISLKSRDAQVEACMHALCL